MSGFKHEQRRLTHRGKTFHFVSYEAQDADPVKQRLAMPATWYLQSSGNRWPAIPHLAEQAEGDRDAQLTEWLELHVFQDA